MSWTMSVGSVNILQDEHMPGLVSTGGLSSISKDLNGGRKKRPLLYMRKNEAAEDDMSDGVFNGMEKKRKLTVEQVNFLETSFNMDLKLEPERKALLAKQLGIRPRQVAIWFQNRRARWKNKQLEQEYETLKENFDAVVKEKDSLVKEHQSVVEANKRLQAEVTRLTSLLQNSENRGMSDASTGAGSEAWPTKEEQLSSGKSEVMSRTKSFNDQSEMQDSGQSYPTPSEAAKFAMADPSVEDLKSGVTCAVKLELEGPTFMPSDNAFGSLPLLVQQLAANGYCLEEAYNVFYECEKHFGGFAFGE
eukprot:c24944_g6_i1 orf=82-996(+)